MIPAFDVDLYLIARYRNTINTCLTNLLAGDAERPEALYVCRMLPILDSRDVPKAINQARRIVDMLLDVVIQQDCSIGFHPPLSWRPVGFSAKFS
jgi:hypothetical protein